MMSFIKKNKHFLLVLLISYLILVLTYGLTAVGIAKYTLFLQMRRYLPCALTVALAVFLWRKAGYTYKNLLPYITTGLLWVIVFPVCYWSAFHNSMTFIDKHYDQAFGAYVFAFTVSLRLLFLKLHQWRDNKVQRLFSAIIQTFAVIIPLFQILYFAYYKYPFTETAAIALLQTNPNEAKEYLLLNFGYVGIIGTIILLASIFYGSYKLNILENSRTKYSEFGKKALALMLLIVVATAGYGAKMFKDTGVMQAYVFAKDYFDRTNKFKEFHDANFANLTVTPSTPRFAKPSTVILVIGESASAYYMSAYSDVKNNNTPWLKSMRNNDNFILFNHAYTSVCQTVPSLERALTEKNQYNKKDFNQSLTVIDIAKKAGYETYWFSNQGYISDADTPITLVAKTADHAVWLSESEMAKNGYQYDGDLLKCLHNVDPNKNNFIVLHFMGSHEDCINRYPYDFARFSEKGKFDMPLNYDDSLAYTDSVLQQVQQYAAEKLNLQAMLYFSDYGGDPYRKRHPDQAGFKALQIPMFVYVSDEYKALYANEVGEFKAKRNTYFTNDLIYETVCSLLQVKSNHFDEGNSLLNSKYKYTREMLMTALGSRKISEDKEPRNDG